MVLVSLYIKTICRIPCSFECNTNRTKFIALDLLIEKGTNFVKYGSKRIVTWTQCLYENNFSPENIFCDNLGRSIEISEIEGIIMIDDWRTDEEVISFSFRKSSSGSDVSINFSVNSVKKTKFRNIIVILLSSVISVTISTLLDLQSFMKNTSRKHYIPAIYFYW